MSTNENGIEIEWADAEWTKVKDLPFEKLAVMFDSNNGTGYLHTLTCEMLNKGGKGINRKTGEFVGHSSRGKWHLAMVEVKATVEDAIYSTGTKISVCKCAKHLK